MNRVWRTFAALALALMVPVAVQAQERPPVAAVFDVEDMGVAFGPEVVERLSDYLATRVGENGRVQVVPRDKLKERIAQEQTESCKDNYARSCQIELGRQVAADKGLASQVMRIGSDCMVTLNLFDLTRVATENTAVVSGDCTEDAVVASLDRAVRRLFGSFKKKGKEEFSFSIKFLPVGGQRMLHWRRAVLGDGGGTELYPGFSIFIGGRHGFKKGISLRYGVEGSLLGLGLDDFDRSNTQFPLFGFVSGVLGVEHRFHGNCGVYFNALGGYFVGPKYVWAGNDIEYVKVGNSWHVGGEAGLKIFLWDDKRWSFDVSLRGQYAARGFVPILVGLGVGY